MAFPAPLPDPAVWKHIICDRDGGNAAEVTNALEKKCVLPLGRTKGASGQVHVSHPLADRLQNAELFLKAYRDNALKFIGPIVTTEENADSGSAVVQYTAAGGFWYVMNRLIGKVGGGSAWGTASSLVSRAYIGQQILKEVNDEGFTGIVQGNVPTMAAEAHYGPVQYVSAGQAIIEVASSLNAFEWDVAPTEPTTVAAIKVGNVIPKQIGTFNMYSIIGTTKPNVVFEYGASSPQVSSYNRKVSRDSLLTFGYTLPPGFPTASTLSVTRSIADVTDVAGVYQDAYNPANTPPGAGSLAALDAVGRHEATISTDIVPDQERKQLSDEHVLVRKKPRTLITFTLAKNAVPRVFDSYGVGDIIRARSVINGVIRFDAFFRVWGLTITVDSAGNEQVELDLSEPQ